MTEHSTVWQYTGKAYSSRPAFDQAEYRDSVVLSAEELKAFTDICDRAYQTEAEIYCDPRREDARGDRDGKAAYVVLDFSLIRPNTGGFFNDFYERVSGFDCLVISADRLPGRRQNITYARAEEDFSNLLCHELNHYILYGILDEEMSSWLIESFAENANHDVRPETDKYLEHWSIMKNESTRARMIPGMLWGDERKEYPLFRQMPYTLGDLFLRYVNHRTTGETNSVLWTEYFAEQTDGCIIMNKTMDAFLQRATGESLEAWMAQFLAELITGGEELYALGSQEEIWALQPELLMFLRDWKDYGQSLSGFELPGAADGIIRERFRQYGLTAVSGGGTAYAYRNDAGGPVSVTGADDNWYFFAVTLELLDPEEVIEISGADQLARIGLDPAHPICGRYLLTEDIDLCGGPENPWPPIGSELIPFTGVFDGNGRTIEGLYIDSGFSYAGLFGAVAGNAEIRNLTVKGSMTGGDLSGGITGFIYDGSVTGCISCVSLTGSFACGGIVGYNYCGVISDCAFSGTVAGHEACGGIAGYESWGQIRNCRSSGEITAVDTDAGGTAGFCDGSRIQNCSHSGSVSGGEDVGGVAGFLKNGAVVECCDAAADVSGSTYVGGVCGWIRDDSVLRNCCHTGTVSGGESVGSVSGGIRTGSIENCYSLFPACL